MTHVFMSKKSGEGLVTNMNDELKLVEKWFKVNKLSLGLAKVECILFSSSTRKPELRVDYNVVITIDNQSIARVLSSKMF